MSLTKQFQALWQRTTLAERSIESYHLQQISISGVRGINDLTVRFDYPVTVLAGENGYGKSTVLFAAACAQDQPEEPMQSSIQRRPPKRQHHPEALLPRYINHTVDFQDASINSTIGFSQLSPHDTVVGSWKHQDGNWESSMVSNHDSKWPVRRCYLRTLMDVANLSETLKSLRPAMDSPPAFELNEFSIDQIKYASSVLPHLQYRRAVEIAGQGASVIFATRDNGDQYSELQMAAGERVALRFGLEVSQLQDALVLIDEVEAGLHPRAQQRLMLGLQWLALHRNLQIIVTTHSPVILDCVPKPGRKFLEGTEPGRVHVVAP